MNRSKRLYHHETNEEAGKMKEEMQQTYYAAFTSLLDQDNQEEMLEKHGFAIIEPPADRSSNQDKKQRDMANMQSMREGTTDSFEMKLQEFDQHLKERLVNLKQPSKNTEKMKSRDQSTVIPVSISDTHTTFANPDSPDKSTGTVEPHGQVQDDSTTQPHWAQVAENNDVPMNDEANGLRIKPKRKVIINNLHPNTTRQDVENLLRHRRL